MPSPPTGKWLWIGRAWPGYALAVLLVLATLLLHAVLGLKVGDPPILILYTVPILVAAYAGGLGPGLLATALAAALSDYLCLHRADGWWIDRPLDRLEWLMLWAVGILISLLTEGLRAARRRAEAANTAVRQSEEAMKLARQQAETANSAKDRFLAVLSHELRTPLTPVVVTISMLQDMPRLGPEMREALGTVRRNVEMEARLIDDLLDVTRIVRGKIELDKRLVPLQEVIRHAVDVCKPDIEGRQLRFGLDLGDTAHCLIEADAARLQQVFWNLLKNAVKFTPHNGCVGIRCRREDNDDGRTMNDGEGKRSGGDVAAATAGAQPRPPSSFITHRSSFVVVEVIDSGEGIDPALLPRIFNAFEQGGPGTTRQFGGLGLGLTITRGLVEMHGGSISAHSQGKGQGATFTVRLPVAPAASPQPREAPSPAGKPARARGARSAPRMPPLKILLVEDHGDTARVMRRLLMARGHEVHRAADVATALELATRDHDFDLLLSDLGLPDGSGHDLMRELRSRGQTLPGIALSGYGQDEDIRRSLEAGFALHLTKPTSPDRLAEAIATIAAQAAPAAR